MQYLHFMKENLGPKRLSFLPMFAEFVTGLGTGRRALVVLLGG